MLSGESWWGLAGGFGRRMPFDATTDFKCDLRVSNYANAAASLLLSDKGRVIWCAEPVEATIVFAYMTISITPTAASSDVSL